MSGGVVRHSEPRDR